MNENLVGNTNNVVEKRKGQVRSWSELKSYLPEAVKPEHLNFLETYCRVQLRIAEGRREKAKEIMNGLAKKTAFYVFEKNNEPLFAAIDIVIRGETGRTKYLGQEKPSFHLNPNYPK